ncbi:uncharacterized protein LOC144100084 [Amblyomma americanum]
MATTTLVVVLLALSLSTATGLSNPVPAYLPAPMKCGPNEVYKTCVSSTCSESTCNPARVSGCVEDCVSGCFCADRYHRNRLHLCVTDCQRESTSFASTLPRSNPKPRPHPPHALPYPYSGQNAYPGPWWSPN